MKLFPSRILLSSFVGCTLASIGAAQGQPERLAPPPPVAAIPSSGSGRIKQLNYGPDGMVNGFVLNNGTLARVAPKAGRDPLPAIRAGATVAYSGYARNTISGRTVVDVETLTIHGQTLNMAMAPPPSGLADARQAGPEASAPTPPPAGRPVPPPPPPPPAGRPDQPTPPPVRPPQL